MINVDNTISRELIEEQINLEEEMTNYGVQKYHKEITDNFENSKLNTVLTANIIKSFHNLVEKQYTEWSSNKAMFNGKAFRIMSNFKDLRVVSFIATKIIINNLYVFKTLTSLSYHIGAALETEALFLKYKDTHKAYYNSIRQSLKERNAGRVWEEVVVKTKFKDKGYGIDLGWTNKDKIRVGLKLIELFIETTGLIKIKRGIGDKRTVCLTQEGQQLIEKLNYKLELLQPFYLPMVCPPRDWLTGLEGGYISPYIKQCQFIKTIDREYLKSINKDNLPKVFEAVNALQSTAWRINDKILDTIKYFLDNNYIIDNVLDFSDVSFTTFPEHLKDKSKEELTEEDKEEIKKWKREVFFQHKSDIRTKSKRFLYYQQVYIAEKFQNKTIYFPHNLDFRGRVYPIPVILNPQGTDLSKSLLTFANASTVTNEEQMDWLRVHGANCYGKDKVSFADRIEFIKSIEDDIKSYAENPTTDLGWTQTDSPFMFLAFCFEYSSYLKTGLPFETNLPIALDGTCNGLQHYTAILKDSRMARMVNLSPSDKPSDIYQVVADSLIKKLTTLLENDDENSTLIDKWLSLGINRKVTKRPVMTLVYGATKVSCTDYIQEYLTDNYSLDYLHQHFGVGETKEECLFKVCQVLAKYLWEVIKEDLFAACATMHYMRQVVKAANSKKQAIRWKSPLGIQVVQEYKQNKKVRLETELFGSMTYMNCMTETNVIDTRKQISSICPNFIHNLDSTMLLNYILLAKEEGITNFSCIHDSIGTDCTNTSLSSHLIRDAFVGLYQDNILLDFTKQVTDRLSEKELKKIPSPPVEGDLDLRDVWDSDYFFS
jgi:DNA-directed RNA polymerase